MKCYSCDKNKSIEVCARCREVLKYELVQIALGEESIYLSESNRNKDGRPKKIPSCDKRAEIYEEYKKGSSYRKLAEKYDVSKSTIERIVKEHKTRFKE